MTRTRLLATILGAVGVLGLGAMAMTHAQQAGDVARPSPDKKALRKRVVDLRAELDLMQLEHDAARAELLDLMKGTSFGNAAGLGQGGLAGAAILEAKAMTGDEESITQLKELIKSINQAGDEKAMQLALKKAAEKQADVLKGTIDRKKKDYTRRAAGLAEKQLDLAEAEERYNRAR